MNSKTSLGIDFGSTGYRAAVVVDGHVVTLPNGRWNENQPGWITFGQTSTTNGGYVQFPSIKYCLESRNPAYTLLGTVLPFKLVVHILQEIKALAESYLDGTTIDQTNIAVPATYSESRRSLILEAAKRAGLVKPGLINAAIAMAGSFSLQHPKDDTLLIYDAGYTQCEIAVVNYARGKFRALAYGHIDRPCGRILDDSILTGCLRALQERGTPLQGLKPQLWLQLQQMAQQFKEKLNGVVDVHLPIPDAETSKNYYISFSKLKFEALIEQLMQESLKEVDRTLHDAKLMKRNISQVIVTGGTTRLTAVQKSLASYFAGYTLHTMTDDAVARGAAAFAAGLLGSQNIDPRPVKIREDGNTITHIGVDFLSPEEVKLAASTPLDMEPDEEQIIAPVQRTAPENRQKKAPFSVAPLWNHVQTLDPDEAQAFLENLQDETNRQLNLIASMEPRRNWRIQKGHKLLEQGKYEEAVQEAHLALATNPDNYQVLVDMIEIHCMAAESFQTIEGYEDAIRWLECARSHDQSDLKTLDLLADRHLLHARQLSEQEEIVPALSAVKACLAVKSGHLAALELRKKLKERLPSS